MSTRELDLLEPTNVTGQSRQMLADSIRLLWLRKKFIWFFVLTFAVLSVIVSLLLPPRYESTTRLLPAPSADVTGGLSRMLRPEASALAGLAGLDSSPGEGRFLALLHSRAIQDRLIDEFGLMTLYQAKYREEAQAALAQRTVITEDRKTGVISITVADRDPIRAAALATGYVKELERLNADMNTSGAHMERMFLEARVEEVGKELHNAAEQLSQFSTKYSIVDAQQQPKSTVDAALSLQGNVVAAEAELKGLQQIYTDNSIKVMAAKARLNELKRQLDTLRGSQSAEGVPKDGSLPSIHNLPTLAVTYSELYRRSKLLEVVQVALTQQLEIAKTDEIRQIPVFRVMDPADVPEYRVFPRRTVMVISLTFAGLLVGIGLVFAGEKWESISPDDPIKILLTDATLLLRGSLRLPKRYRREESCSAIAIREKQ